MCGEQSLNIGATLCIHGALNSTDPSPLDELPSFESH